jgi:hypothetical protein
MAKNTKEIVSATSLPGSAASCLRVVPRGVSKTRAPYDERGAGCCADPGRQAFTTPSFPRLKPLHINATTFSADFAAIQTMSPIAD